MDLATWKFLRSVLDQSPETRLSSKEAAAQFPNVVKTILENERAPQNVLKEPERKRQRVSEPRGQDEEKTNSLPGQPNEPSGQSPDKSTEPPPQQPQIAPARQVSVIATEIQRELLNKCSWIQHYKAQRPRNACARTWHPFLQNAKANSKLVKSSNQTRGNPGIEYQFRPLNGGDWTPWNHANRE